MDVDDRIRDEIGRMQRPVPLQGVLERVARRRSRVRRARRVRTALLAAAVVAGSAVGAVLLAELFRPPARQDPAAAVTVPPLPVCDATEVSGDLDGDGMSDRVRVLALASDPAACDGQGKAFEFWAEIVLADGRQQAQPLPECAYPAFCAAVAAPDLDGDARSELAIRLFPGATAAHLAFYAFSADPERPLHRIDIRAPADPWDPQFGLKPGPALLPWGGSVTHVHGLACAEDAGGRVLVVQTAVRENEGEYRLHRTDLRLDGTELVVIGSEDQTVSELGPELEELAPDDQLCGAPVTF